MTDNTQKYITYYNEILRVSKGPLTEKIDKYNARKRIIKLVYAFFFTLILILIGILLYYRLKYIKDIFDIFSVFIVPYSGLFITLIGLYISYVLLMSICDHVIESTRKNLFTCCKDLINFTDTVTMIKDNTLPNDEANKFNTND